MCIRDRTTTGHVPAEDSVLVTVRALSGVQASLIVIPSASRPATVVSGAEASEAVHPSTVTGAIVPVITGAVLSSTLMACVAVAALPQASGVVCVFVTATGHV